MYPDILIMRAILDARRLVHLAPRSYYVNRGIDRVRSNIPINPWVENGESKCESAIADTVEI